MDVDPEKPGRSPPSSFPSLPSISSGPFHHPTPAITPHPVDPKAHLRPWPNQHNRKNPVSFYGNTQETIDAVLNSVQRMRPNLPLAAQMTMSMSILQKASSPLVNAQKHKESMPPQQPPPPADPSKPLTWRQKETRKGAVSHPTAKGTNSTELHFSLPKSAATEHLFSSHGRDLLAQFLGSTVGHLTDEQLVLFDENSLVAAWWSVKGNLVLRFNSIVSEDMYRALSRALHLTFTPSHQLTETQDPSAPPSPPSIQLLNKPPTTCLKFMAVATMHGDGRMVTDEELLIDLRDHLAWQSVDIWTPPKFLVCRGDDLKLAHIVVVSVIDDSQGSVGKSLMNTVVCFSSCGNRTCL